ncbi:MAG: hypothetical protein FWC97_03685 [Treponema sp.]|nr:hypothetical protein [Treponema sp.]
MKSLRILIAVIILTVVTTLGFTQVYQDEMRDLPPVTFINFEGPHAWVNTREEIRQIGVALGLQLTERTGVVQQERQAMTVQQRLAHTYSFQVGQLNRYFIIRSTGGTDDGRLNADIIGIGVDAAVDHVRNLRVIIQGFLQAAYNYSANDALLLAEYITIYNAVYRGNWDYFSNRFQPQVVSHLTRERVGLSIRFDEWPGQTLMVIPLGPPGISAVDIAAIASERVIEEMRREDDQGIPQRQQLVELLEREADIAEQRAQEEHEVIRQEEIQIAEERAQIEEERTQIEEERQQIQEEQNEGIITEEQAREAEQELEEREQELEEREQELAEREEELEERREQAQMLEDFAEQRMEQAQQHREEIAEDQQTMISQEIISGVHGVALNTNDPAMGRVLLLNPADGSELRRSPLDTVRTRTVTVLGGRILAVAGEATGRGAIRLIELNPNSLEMARQGDHDIYTSSLLWVNGNDLYAITVDINNTYLGRFNTNLQMLARSQTMIHPEASIIIQQGLLLTQRPDGSPLMLNPADLTEIHN